MTNRSADEILEYIIRLFTYYLENFNDGNSCEEEQFICGERTAYVECLEIIQFWEHAEKHGLNFDIEAKFPL